MLFVVEYFAGPRHFYRVTGRFFWTAELYKYSLYTLRTALITTSLPIRQGRFPGAPDFQGTVAAIGHIEEPVL